jgi:ABC-type microcin C transport system duplicated ATPase subunit YejF
VTVAAEWTVTGRQDDVVFEARGLVKRYGHVTAFDGSDFELRAGEVLGVVGDNGAGSYAARAPPAGGSGCWTGGPCGGRPRAR